MYHVLEVSQIQHNSPSDVLLGCLAPLQTRDGRWASNLLVDAIGLCTAVSDYKFDTHDFALMIASSAFFFARDASCALFIVSLVLRRLFSLIC